MSKEKFKFPVNVWIKENHAAGEGFWKFLCIVHDNEALGIIERRFDGTELKVQGFEHGEGSSF